MTPDSALGTRCTQQTSQPQNPLYESSAHMRTAYCSYAAVQSCALPGKAWSRGWLKRLLVQGGYQAPTGANPTAPPMPSAPGVPDYSATKAGMPKHQDLLPRLTVAPRYSAFNQAFEGLFLQAVRELWPHCLRDCNIGIAQSLT